MDGEAPKVPIPDVKVMSQDDKDECARNYRNTSFETAESASRRGGMLHIKRKEMFWGDALHFRTARHKNWTTTLKREYTFEQGMAFHNGTNAGRDVVVSSPKWTWILQTICLGIAVIDLFILFLVFLFH